MDNFFTSKNIIASKPKVDVVMEEGLPEGSLSLLGWSCNVPVAIAALVLLPASSYGLYTG